MYPHLFLAGTFDGLHAGHQAVINTAFRVSEKVTIGVTSDGFIAKFKSQIPISNVQKTIHSYRERKRNVELWLREQGYFERATIIPISDPYEPAASMKDLDALIVTPENRTTGEHINALRQGSTLPRLSLIEVPMVAAQDGAPISSTRMRNGEIDYNGCLIMPDDLRPALHKPMGKIRKNWIPDRVGDDKIRITVGDIATKTFLDAGILPRLAIIDGMVGRKPFPEVADRFKDAIVVKSGPGYISKEAIRAIEQMPRVLLIDGEEDLLVLPAIMHAPLGSILYYGQPGEGLVEVVVTNSIKKQALALLGKFT